MAGCKGVPFSLNFLISGVEAVHEGDEYYQQLPYPEGSSLSLIVITSVIGVLIFAGVAIT